MYYIFKRCIRRYDYVSLFAAVPCGLFMHEPLIATISTLVGTIFFTIYVIYSFKSNKTERAKIVISLIFVFIKNTTTILQPSEDYYAVLTGDQCALTNIRITNTKS